MKYNSGIETDSHEWLNLHRNENLYIDEGVLRQLVQSAFDRMPIRMYPDTNCHELKAELASFHGVSKENLFIGNGADEVLSSLFFLFRKRLNRVHLPRISFKMYDALASKYSFGIDYFDNHPIIDGDPDLNMNGFYVLDTPCSITGYAYSRKTINKVLENPENWLVEDNVYGEFCGDKVDDIQPNRVIIRHFSKFYGLAALRIGYCIASKDIISEMDEFREPFNVNSLGLLAAVDCLRHFEYFANVADAITTQRLIFESSLKELGFFVCKSSANFLLVKHPAISSEQVNKALMQDKIATRHFASDPILKEFLRIGVPPADRMRYVIHSLQKILDNVSSFAY